MTTQEAPAFDVPRMLATCTLLRGIVGSTVHGLAVADQDDLDEMGICAEPWGHFFGLVPRWEQCIERTQPEGARSGPGDRDCVTYSLAKWIRLALNGNPTIMLILFVPDSALTHRTPAGERLRAMASNFLSNETLDRYLGYMREQRRRMIDRVKMPRRPELIERYGFDTKYAGHVLRLGYQGIELAETGRLTLPMAEPVRSHLVNVRTGGVSEIEVLRESEHLEDRLTTLRSTNPFQPPDTDAVEAFMIDTYLEYHPHAP